MKEVVKEKGGSGFVYFMAWLGALVYYVQQANGFGQVIVAFLKACVWPAFLVYDVLRYVS